MLLADFQGQEKIRENVGIFMSAARARGAPLPHLLLVGPSGIGKLALARAISEEWGHGARITSGGTVGGAAELAGILANLQPLEVLILEDLNRLSASVQEVLAAAMGFLLEIPIGEGPMQRIMKIDLPSFTLIATTMKPAALSDDLRANCTSLRFEPYDESSLTHIVLRIAASSEIRMSEDAAREVARASGGVPRNCVTLVQRLLDFAHLVDKTAIDLEVARHGISRIGGVPLDLADPGNNREQIAQEVRHTVWRRDQGRCVQCGSQVRLEFDHIIPVVHGGSNTVRNIQLLCEVCNRAKSATV